MRIGITERGDAGICFDWVPKIDTVEGVVLITKNITPMFIRKVLECNKPVIVHCTCTGWGRTEIEPNVPNYRTQLDSLKHLIDSGFPAEHCVLRIDPIFPSGNGLKRVHEVLSYFQSLQTGVERIRISIVDEYRHVKERYIQHGWQPLYQQFQADDSMLYDVMENLARYQRTFETCAENRLYQLSKEKYPDMFETTGCISEKDLSIMGIPFTLMGINPQQRHGCHCLSCKTELLTERKQCPNQCVYCFWK